MFQRKFSRSFLVVGLLGLSVTLFTPPAAKGEAAANLLGRYTCSQIKKLVQTDPVQIFDMWLKSDQILGSPVYAGHIRSKIGFKGPYADVVEYTGQVNTLIEGLEEAVNGTPENVYKIFAKQFIKETMASIGKGTAEGGILGAVITLGTELHQFAEDLNAEILDINVNNIASAVLGEQLSEGYTKEIKPIPKLLNEKYFLEKYLGWNGEAFEKYDSIGKAWEMNARRSMLVDYAGYKLGWDVTGKENTLGGWRLNEIRTAIHILLKDVRAVVAKKEKIKKLQGELKVQLQELKREQAMLGTFNSLRQQVLSMTCLDSPTDGTTACLDSYQAALVSMNDAILEKSTIRAIPESALDSLKNSLEDLYTKLVSHDTYLQDVYGPEVRAYCDAQTANALPLTRATQQAESIVSDITAAQARARDSRDSACSATSKAAAEKAANSAKNTASVALHYGQKLPAVPTYNTAISPPSPTTIGGSEQELSELSSTLADYQKTVEGNRDKINSFNSRARATRAALQYMLKLCKNTRLNNISAREKAAQLDTQLTKAESNVPDSRYRSMFLDGLTSKADAIRWYIPSLQSKSEAMGQCVDALPDVDDLVANLQALLEQGQALVENAKSQSLSALACVESHDTQTHCNSDAGCPRGQRCSAPGLCVPAEKEETNTLFSVSGTEKIDKDQPLFSVSGSEKIPNSTANTSSKVDCSNVPGSTLVQGSCICADGLILSPSQHRCLSCNDYYNWSRNAVNAGDFNAARAILGEAPGCSGVIAQIESQINDAVRGQACDVIAANIRVACQNNNAQAVRSFMGRANQQHCNISDDLWQWGNSVLAQQQQLDNERLAAQQQAQQSQNSTSWADVFSAVTQGIKQIDDNRKPSKPHPLPSNTPTFPPKGGPSSPMPGMTGLVMPQVDSPWGPGSGSNTPGNGSSAGSSSGYESSGAASGGSRVMGSSPSSGGYTGESITGGGTRASPCELKLCPICAPDTSGITLMGKATNPQCNPCIARHRSEINRCHEAGASTGVGGASRSQSEFQTYKVVKCSKWLKDSSGRVTGASIVYEVTGPERNKPMPKEYSCSFVAVGTWDQAINEARRRNQQAGNSYYVN